MPTTLKEFESVFPKLVEDLKNHCKESNLPTQALDWIEQVRHVAIVGVLDLDSLSHSRSITMPWVGSAIAACQSSIQRQSF